MKKISRIILTITVLMIVNVFPLSAKTKVKVAYPIQDRLTELSEDGVYSGYTYDYLKELERFTSFEFEYVIYQGDVNEKIVAAMDDVASGKVDLMGAMLYDESAKNVYDYTSSNYGMGNIAIYVLSDNTEINDTNIYSLKELNVGIFSSTHKEDQKLKEFGEMNGIKIIQHFYESEEKLMEDFNNGKIESIAVSEQAGITGNYRVVATFSPRPFYFVTTKGKREILSEINEAMVELNKEQPSFMSDLHEKYFSFKSGDFILTEAEKEFLKQHSVIDVALLGGKAPLQSKNKNGNLEGISIDILDYIGELTNVKFKYHYAETYDEYEKLLEDENIIMAGGLAIPYYEAKKNFECTRSYLDSGLEIVMTKGLDASNIVGQRLALPKGTYYSGEYDGKVVYYDTPLECFEAVNNGEADYSYLGSHIALFYSSSYDFDNITMIPQYSNYSIKNCFAIRKDVSSPLTSIINKGIDKASTTEIQSIVFKNATYAKEELSIMNYIQNNPLQFAGFILVLIGIYYVLRVHMQKKNDKKLLMEYNRFQKISDLSGDCFIEYNVKEDTLKLSGGAAILISPHKVIKNYLHSDDKGASLFHSILDNKRTYDKEIRLRLIDGSERWQRIFLQPMFDQNNCVSHIIGKITDIQNQKEEQLLWKDLAKRDSLTKVYNSAACHEMFDQLLEGSHDNEIALIILDIDNFKSINDNYGHYCGDQVLVQLAQIIVNSSKTTDIVARVGGDEFIIGLNHPRSMKEINYYCQKLMESMSEFKICPMTISMGIAISIKGQNYDDLYQLADKALYDAKNAGRNNYRFANEMKKSE